ncbi:serine hydrolase domain-containing protein [Nonomuraea jiangxiensis]|uniref:CubicO group peptidase, beta-lactamase class C family n=1 Tax=Nonomuraea jiangxiensis TaxID=633440 RepID=A0A1G8LAG3_9ACTN|nr:serine hydrolase domain-containing protein [Nonomuraea jiangxiensis]SDI52190.1 CubicO group peptidase, beta-lactamase class C family [Nonomuraea jiangxiensis]
MSITTSDLRERLTTQAERHGVPGAVLAVLHDGAVVEAATGVLNTRTGVAVTPDSVFQIGSVTKTWTATLVMQLVDEGLLDLDRPVRAYLPAFALADETAAAHVTVRHLLAHTAGFAGEDLTDYGRDEGAVAALVANLSGAAQVTEPGTLFSYNNAGFVVLGRLAEVLRGESWGPMVRRWLAGPLGLGTVVTLPEQALLHRTAVGHVEVAGTPGPAPAWALPRALDPAGGLAMSAADLLEFARLHLRHGLARDDARLLSRDSAEAMRTHQSAPPPLSAFPGSYGLGMERHGWDGGTVLGHAGSTIGQYAYLRMVPEADVAVVLLTNGGGAEALHADLVHPLLAELAGVRAPAPVTPPAAAPLSDPGRYVGDFDMGVATIRIGHDGQGPLTMTVIPRVAAVEALVTNPVTELAALDDVRFVEVGSDRGEHRDVIFLDPGADGRFRILHNSRAMPRMA